MKAIVFTRYGLPDVLRLVEIEKPVPNDNEVLIKVRAASVNAFDYHLMRGKPLPTRFMSGGLLKPKVTRFGRDVAGVVEAVGRNVTQLKPGDGVFGACVGSFAEYACAKEDKLALKPANVSFEAAAAVPIAAITALQGLRDKGRVEPGQKVAVDGASGGVGTFAVLIARAFGARVTAVCSTRHQDEARSIGADRVIDYTKEDFTRSSERYDLIYAANAYHSIFDYRRALGASGTLLVSGGGARILQIMLLGPMLSCLGRKKVGLVSAKIKQPDLVALGDLLAAGKIVPFIDRRYPLSEAAQAVRYLGEGHAGGKVVITVEPS